MYLQLVFLTTFNLAFGISEKEFVRLRFLIINNYQIYVMMLVLVDFIKFNLNLIVNYALFPYQTVKHAIHLYRVYNALHY